MERRGASSRQRWLLGVWATGVFAGAAGLIMATTGASAATTASGASTSPRQLCAGSVCVGSPTPASSGRSNANPPPGGVTLPGPGSSSTVCVFTVCLPSSVTTPTLPSNPLNPTKPSTPSGPTRPTEPVTHAQSGLATNAASGGSSGTGTGTAAQSAPARIAPGFGDLAGQLPVSPATAGVTVPPPAPIQLVTPGVSGLPFGKAPFLWPLFVGLDVLGFGAVAFVLRRTWSKPVMD